MSFSAYQFRPVAQNQKPLYIVRKLLPGGQNTRVNPSSIGEDEGTVVYNADIAVPGQADKRPGINLIANDVGTRTMALQAYYPTGGTPALYRVEGVNVRKWTGSGSWSSSLGTVTTGLDTCLLRGGESGENEVLFLQNGTDNAQRINSADAFQDLGSGATSPPKTVNNIFVNNRWWVLKNGFLYYSDAFSADYSGAFSSSNGFRFSGYGDDKGLFAIRDNASGLAATIIVFMQNGIFGLTPSATPAATDRPYVVTTNHGVVDRKCIAQMGDDIAYLAPDGVRTIKRTMQDQLQFGVSYPLSYRLKDEFDDINWNYASKFHMTFWQDKLFFFYVASSGTDINRCWVYWPALDNGSGKGWAVMTGWTITSTAKFYVSGEENLYGGSTDGKVYQIWTGQGDNGSAVNLQIETRDEDLGQPALHKSGGELEVVAEATGNYDITVSASIDGGSYTTLGTMNLSSGAPTLPISLPFNLSSAVRISEKFHLDSLGRWKVIRFKFQHNATNSTDNIRLYEYRVLSYPDSYEEES